MEMPQCVELKNIMIIKRDLKVLFNFSNKTFEFGAIS